MALEGKPTTSLLEADLQVLIADQVREGKTIEYKVSLPDNTHDGKREFLADVSSFANSDGGHLLFGVEEQDGLPIAFPGLSPADIDPTIQRLENLIRDGLQPRLSGVQFGLVKLGSGNVVLVLRMSRSWSLPHRVILGGHDKFYARNSAGKYPLDVLQLRSLFLLSESLAERVRGFRAERLSAIVSGTTPVPLYDISKTVLHIVPFSAFTPGMSLAVSDLADDSSKWPPIGRSGWSHRLNFDGFLTYSENSEDGKSYSYLQVFRNGCIEAVDGYIIREHEGKKYIPGNYWEHHLLEAVSTYVTLLERLEVQAPIVLMLSLVGVRGYTMYLPLRYRLGETLIDRDNLLMSEILADTLNFLWTIPSTKAGRAHVIPLPHLALEEILKLPRLAENPYVFCGRWGRSHLINLSKPWRRIRKEAKLDDVRIHDLRRTLGSWLVAAGASLPLIGKALNHSQPATTAIYARMQLDPVRAALEENATRMLTIIENA